MQRIYSFLLFSLICCLITACTASNQATSRTDRGAPTASPREMALRQLETAETYEDLTAAAATLQELAQAAPQDWLASYYAGYAYGVVAHSETDLKKIDDWCSRGGKFLDAAATSGGAEDEILIGRAHLIYAGIKVNMMRRGFDYSRKAMGYLLQAVSIDDQNPRARLLMAQHYLNVPIQLGGDRDKACELNARALEDFKREAATTTDGPRWGRAESQSFVETNCDTAKK